MSDEDLSREAMREKIQEAIRQTREEKFEEAIETFEDHLSELSEGDLQDKRLAAGAFSYYGLCVAMVRRKYADALKYCNISLKANFMEPEHRINLAQVYLERDDRRKAIEHLEAGLRLQPSNRRIQKIYEQIGQRQPPVISFLSRRNPINVWLGKMRVPKDD